MNRSKVGDAVGSHLKFRLTSITSSFGLLFSNFTLNRFSPFSSIVVLILFFLILDLVTVIYWYIVTWFSDSV